MMSTEEKSKSDRQRAGHLYMRRGWVRFLRDIEPERPRLFRYCRKLSGNVWDAEDLVQDTMLKAFGSLAVLDDGPEHWAAYLSRIASNLWIDQMRRSQPLRLDEIAEPSVPARSASGPSIGDGGRALMTRLSPQERCAIVMKEVFEFSLAETAGLLGTSEGAIKAALHRGREKLADPTPSTRPIPSEAVVQKFVDAFNAADIEAIKATMLDSVSVEVFALGRAHGLANVAKQDRWIQVSLNGHTPDPTRHQRAERRLYQGEPIVILWRRYGDGDEQLEELWRIQERDGGISHIWDYCACPETLREVANELGHPVATRSYAIYYGDETEA